jgi:glutathione S-transferase
MILGEWMPEWESALSKRAWVAGDALTLADFALAETLEGLSLYLAENGTAKENSLARFPAVCAYMTKFQALPKVAAYRVSAGYMARPFNNKSAAWK